jgi:hypothetical protein
MEMHDGTRFRFHIEWRMKDSTGALREYAETLVYRDTTEARRKHAEACRGGWVKRGWLSPHVSALKVWKDGRELQEELAGKAEVPEFLRGAA